MVSDTGLREEKKQRTRQEILANAIALFRKHGIRETRTNEIAQLSGISAGTLFNYFATKDALVEAWLRGELDGIVAGVASSLGERGLRPMLRGVCRVLTEDCLESSALRREGWRMLGRGRSADFCLQLGTPLVDIVRAEQKRDRIREDLAARTLAEMLMDGLEGGLIAALEEEEPDSASLSRGRGLELRVDLILDGMRKRNQRVAAPAIQRAATGVQG